MAGGRGNDIAISDNSNMNINSYSNFGDSYDLPPGVIYRSKECQSYLAGSKNFQTQDIEVYALNNV